MSRLRHNDIRYIVTALVQPSSAIVASILYLELEFQLAAMLKTDHKPKVEL